MTHAGQGGNWEDEIESLRKVVDTLLRDRKSLRILEAGCGSYSHLGVIPEATVVGVDISQAQLAKNDRLHEKRLGDIQSCDLGSRQFDLIICWDVLEHLDRPQDAVLNFFRAVKDDGIIVLAMPNVLSVKGLVTKFTPHSFHIYTYRYLWRQKHVGRKGHYSPFQTPMRLSASPHAIKRLAAEHGFIVEYFRLYEGIMQAQLRKRSTTVDWMFRVVGPFLEKGTRGKIQAARSDAILVLRKNALVPDAGGRLTPSTSSR